MALGSHRQRAGSDVHSAEVVRPTTKDTTEDSKTASDTFKTPEEVAKNDDAQPQHHSSAAPEQDAQHTGTSEKPVRRSLRDRIAGINEKQWLIICGVLVVVIIGGGFAIFGHHKAKPPVAQKHSTAVKKAPAAPVSTQLYSRLTGMPVDAAAYNAPVTGVMIENSTDARPQSGLDQAGVVFEAVAEGGITRFLTLFQDQSPPYLGPVRSVRPYYIQWALGFDAPIAHVGGSPEALQDMKDWHVGDLDQFYNGSYYHRISSRYAPHNVYTSLDELHTLEGTKGITKSTFTGFDRKKDEPVATPAASTINLTISSSYFNVMYQYDKTLNAYKRSEGGVPHTVVDQAGKTTQLEPKVVVALVMNQGIEADDLHTSYGTIGSGHMYVFQDGNVIEGTWAKSSNSSQFTFTNLSGVPIKLNAGQTWITAVGAAKYVTYTP